YGDSVAALGGRLVDYEFDQFHHDNLQYARAGHDAAQDAAVRMVDSDHRIPALAGVASARRRNHDAADRPQFRDDVLRSGGRGRSDSVPAPVLVLRTPRSVHHDPAAVRYGFTDCRYLLEKAGLRLSWDGLCDGRSE